jgi:predicted secreted protein/outer membrane lipoprotein-sorting protein
MRDYHGLILAVPVLAMLFFLVICSGCIAGSRSDVNLSAGELADLYLDNAGAIRDYRAEYIVTSGMATENPVATRIRFDYKSPSFNRMEVVESGSRVPGTFATANGTTTSWYDSAAQTYDTSSGMNLSQEYDYQRMVRQIVADRNFTIIGSDTSREAARYLIGVVTAPWSSTYTPYISSRINAWIEPSTGRAWTITTYYDCNAPGIPTPTPPPASAVPPGMCPPSDVPNNEISYESIEVNTGIPDSYFDFVPPAGSGPRCVPKYMNYVEPARTDPSVPVDQPLPGGVRYSFSESDSGRTVMLRAGDVIEITLGTIPGLGYRWIMPSEGSGLELLNAGPFYEMPENDGNYYFMGGRGYYRWRFKAVDPGTETIDGIFSLGGCDIQYAKRFNLTVEVSGNG